MLVEQTSNLTNCEGHFSPLNILEEIHHLKNIYSSLNIKPSLVLDSMRYAVAWTATEWHILPTYDSHFIMSVCVCGMVGGGRAHAPECPVFWVVQPKKVYFRLDLITLICFLSHTVRESFDWPSTKTWHHQGTLSEQCSALGAEVWWK